MTYDEFQASEEKPDKKAKTKAGSKRKRSPSPVEKKVKFNNLFHFKYKIP
jgi:hypothetical protein